VHSGSFDGYFGVIYATPTAEIIRLAEMLIHESSHQHFHLLTRLAPLAEEDERLFYSPFARAQRHADRILLAYHAFANVELFYRACLERGIQTARALDGIARFQADLDAVERVLADEAALTPIGRELLEALVLARANCERHD
jgi:HEXXH motif-containing protein